MSYRNINSINLPKSLQQSRVRHEHPRLFVAVKWQAVPDFKRLQFYVSCSCLNSKGVVSDFLWKASARGANTRRMKTDTLELVEGEGAGAGQTQYDLRPLVHSGQSSWGRQLIYCVYTQKEQPGKGIYYVIGKFNS